MLATMRPAPIHSTDTSMKQQNSSLASTSSKTFSKDTQMNNKPNGPTRSQPKKGNHSAGKQIAPGLLSLSKPLDEYQDSDEAEKSTSSISKKQSKKKKHAASADTCASNAPKAIANPSAKAKKKPLAIDEIKAEENQLSRSAPDSHSSLDWDMPQSAKASKDVNSALTWQQQLFNSQAPKSATLEKRKGGKRERGAAPSSAKSKSAQVLNDSKNETSSALTWQQELFGSNEKIRGPAFDVFADERDALTFGGNTPPRNPGKEGKKKQRQRADSLGDLHLHNQGVAQARSNKSKGSANSPFVHLGANEASSSPSSGPPTTPNKLAYAGPNFHNSPSPASLPVPKFLQSKNASGGNGTGISSSMSANATSNSSLFAREAQAQNQQIYQQSQPTYHHPPPLMYQNPPFSQNTVPYNHSFQHAEPNVSNSSRSSEDDQDANTSHSLSRFTRGVTAPPELPSTPFMNGTGDGSVIGADHHRNETIENLLAKMMRPGSE